MHILMILFLELTPRFSQKISIGSDARSTWIHFPSMYQSSNDCYFILNNVRMMKLINHLARFTLKLSTTKFISFQFSIVTNADPTNRCLPFSTSSFILSYSICFSIFSICYLIRLGSGYSQFLQHFLYFGSGILISRYSTSYSVIFIF